MNAIHKAEFSPDRRYRYRLDAALSDDGGVCMFLMLNPSKADETRSDPTVTRCKRFAARWGYGALSVCNLFALRSTDPAALTASEDPVGADNDEHLLKAARAADAIVCAWGNHGEIMNRGKRVERALRGAGLSGRMRHLGLTKRDHPRHPLYLRRDARPIRWQLK